MNTEIVPATPGAIATRQAGSAIELIAIETEVIKARHAAVQKLVDEVFVREVHFGPAFPSADEDSFLKPGLELAASLFSLALEYEVQPIYSGDEERYIVTCRVLHQPTGAFMGSGVGECSTAETKWQWKGASRTQFDATPADRRREKVEWDGKVKLQIREEVADKANTCLKMASKRAAADAVQAVLGIRGMIRFPPGQKKQQAQGARRGRQAPAPAIVTAAQLEELLSTCRRKGMPPPELVANFARNAYSGPLDKLPVEQWEWAMAGLSERPDVADENGEVLPGQAEDVPFGAFGDPEADF